MQHELRKVVSCVAFRYIIPFRSNVISSVKLGDGTISRLASPCRVRGMPELVYVSLFLGVSSMVCLT